MQTFLFDKISTPIGELMVVADKDHHLRALEWSEFEGKLHQTLKRRYRDSPVRLTPSANPGGLSETLQRYFAGELTAIDTLPVAAAGTDFQQQVWKALRDIPCGSVMSYGQLAARLGRPTASRAVGMANGANPICIVVPCHRVIGAGGALTGYAGGIQRKQWLLIHEGYLS
ncbi:MULTISPECIES: methylated-DNA--[protein]-cysteine S-methyltransferase [Lonsdalea]|uniref:Cysteine methyltransferase n=2 Tax=Lonsdalea TaxID=1082702 RepID=A0ACD1J9I3_9GAMM|nr:MULTISPECIES: methylated-DNA--[protein]-cysteine S-methyltransferase [Lonsdalea]OSN02586.1 cysteine methyltransferase [Lonsdalea populi]QPQ25656.1 methylated-DNA--[protein]-cysteine S-methyltransferase [Lonsdalea populi]RAT11678.1 cysteine methyltransferase [Lonsdalea quercina]RAT18181.1 cysteine methyltransferase [Lonsdalea quercina]RAT19312.1 cysteine methyltransferase [Lonsdalea populi]